MAAGLGRSGLVDCSPAADPHGFDLREAHGVCNRRGWRLHASSAALGWRNLFVSSQTEIPEEADYGSVRHHLLVVHRNGPASHDRARNEKDPNFCRCQRSSSAGTTFTLVTVSHSRAL